MKRKIFFLLAATMGCGRQHQLSDGVYEFRATHTARDACGLAALGQTPTRGTLRTSGDRVEIDYDFGGGVRCVGGYLSGVERLAVDGTLTRLTLQVLGRECTADYVHVRLDGAAEGPGSWSGQMSIQVDTQDDACRCQASYGFAATKAPEGS